MCGEEGKGRKGKGGVFWPETSPVGCRRLSIAYIRICLPWRVQTVVSTTANATSTLTGDVLSGTRACQSCASRPCRYEQHSFLPHAHTYECVYR